MKTREVTLPPLFSGWDGNPLADGSPSRESSAQPRASEGLADLGELQVWLKQTVRAWWGLSSGWELCKHSQEPGGLSW